MTKRFERIYADVDVFCRDHDAKGISQLLEKEDYDTIVDLLNELNDEKQQLLSANTKLTEENTNLLSTIRQAYQSERTALGRNVLKQLLDNLE